MVVTGLAVASALLDLDFLGWGTVTFGDHEAGSPLMLRNLAAVASNYREGGISVFVLARFVSSYDELRGIRRCTAPRRPTAASPPPGRCTHPMRSKRTIPSVPVGTSMCLDGTLVSRVTSKRSRGSYAAIGAPGKPAGGESLGNWTASMTPRTVCPAVAEARLSTGR